jgi:hypothetical protein
MSSTIVCMYKYLLDIDSTDRSLPVPVLVVLVLVIVLVLVTALVRARLPEVYMVLLQAQPCLCDTLAQWLTYLMVQQLRVRHNLYQSSLR